MGSIESLISRSARQNVQEALDKAASSKDYNIFISLNPDRALARADEVDASSKKGRLAGVPFVVKDNFLTKDEVTTAASKMLEDFTSPLTSTAVELLEAEGAICIGKVNLDAFAHGGSTENSAFGVTKNAFDGSRVAGGSSGGSAVAVALDIVPFALGSDTGGSIRQPASFNGVVGIKPTYGTVSRYGVVAMASSTDCIGVLSDTVETTEVVMSIISGRDDKDATTLPDFFSPVAELGKKKVGVIKEFMSEDVDPEVLRVTQDYIQSLKDSGHEVEEVSLPMAKYALAVYYVVVPAEVSSNLARYDGVKYGLRAPEAKNLDEVYGLSREAGFMTENKRRIMIGSYVLSSGFFDAYYLQAQKVRTLLIQEFDNLFDNYDVLVGPVSPTPAFKIGENIDDPVKMYLADIMTVPASLAGLPAISIPAGKTKDGLPVGVQLIGQRQSDAMLLAMGREAI